jgi:hypothetical protein
MGEFSGMVYRPVEPSHPIVIAIFKDKTLVAFKPVASEEEGWAEIKRAVEELPKLA